MSVQRPSNEQTSVGNELEILRQFAHDCRCPREMRAVEFIASWIKQITTVEPSTRLDRRYVPGDYVFTEGKNAVALECPQVSVMYEDGTIERRPLHCTSRNTEAPKGITVEMITKACAELRATVPPSATPYAWICDDNQNGRPFVTFRQDRPDVPGNWFPVYRRPSEPPCASCESVSQIAADTGLENLRVMDERDRYKQALYQANGRLIQLGLDPVKLEYSGSTKEAKL